MADHDPGCAPEPRSWLPDNPVPLIGIALIVLGLGILSRGVWLHAAYAAGYVAGVFAPTTLFVAFVVGYPIALVFWGNNKGH